MLPLDGPRLTKLRVQTLMMPPKATAHINWRGVLKIIEKPMAEMAAASIYSW